MRNDAAGIPPALCRGWGVYAVVAMDGRPDKRMVKIGISSSMESRMRMLRTHSPHPLIIARWRQVEDKEAALYLERLVHRHWWWERYRTHGEWFDMPRGSLMMSIDAMDVIDDPVYGAQWPLPPGIKIVVAP